MNTDYSIDPQTALDIAALGGTLRSKRLADKRAKVAHIVMTALLPLWNSELDEEMERVISRYFYIPVFDTCNIKTGLSTMPLNVKYDKKIHTWDHYTRPQTIAKFIMDNPTEYLHNYSKFRYMFEFCRQVILCTKVENNLLKDQTNVKNKGSYKDNSVQGDVVGSYTHMQYIDKGIRLYDSSGLLPTDTALNVPAELIEWETQFFANNYRPTTAADDQKPTLESFYT
jgi:hypothetical protein